MYQLTNSRRRHLYSAPSFVDDLLRKHCLVGLPILNGFLAAKLPTSTDLCSPFNLRDCGKMQASLFACAAECRRAPEPCRCGTLHRKSGRADCDSVWSVCREFPHAPGDARSPNEAPTVATKPSSARSSGTCAWNMFRGSVLHGTTLLRSAIPARLLLHVVAYGTCTSQLCCHTSSEAATSLRPKISQEQARHSDTYVAQSLWPASPIRCPAL